MRHPLSVSSTPAVPALASTSGIIQSSSYTQTHFGTQLAAQAPTDAEYAAKAATLHAPDASNIPGSGAPLASPGALRSPCMFCIRQAVAPIRMAPDAAQSTGARPRPPRPAQTPAADAPRAAAPLAVGGGLGLRAGALGLARARPLARQHARELVLAHARVGLRGGLPVPCRVRLLACARPGSGRGRVKGRVGPSLPRHSSFAEPDWRLRPARTSAARLRAEARVRPAGAHGARQAPHGRSDARACESRASLHTSLSSRAAVCTQHGGAWAADGAARTGERRPGRARRGLLLLLVRRWLVACAARRWVELGQSRVGSLP